MVSDSASAVDWLAVVAFEPPVIEPLTPVTPVHAQATPALAVMEALNVIVKRLALVNAVVT